MKARKNTTSQRIWCSRTSYGKARGQPVRREANSNNSLEGYAAMNALNNDEMRKEAGGTGEAEKEVIHSHSIVPGGLLVTS